jgi:hypothetical protein
MVEYVKPYPGGFRNRGDVGAPTPMSKEVLNNFQDGIAAVADVVTGVEEELEGRLSEPALAAAIGEVATVKAYEPVNVRDFGAKGDGATDDYASIRAAALAAQAAGRALYFPDGTYQCSGTIPWDGTIYGDNMYTTRINGTDPTKPVLASKAWLTEFGGTPSGRSALRNIRINGGLYGVVLHDWRVRIENVFIEYSASHGLFATINSQAGVPRTGNLVGNVFRNIRVAYTGGIPFHGGEVSNGIMTDGKLIGAILIATATSLHNLLVGQAAGWQIDEIHTYGGPPTDSPIRLYRCGYTQVGRIMVEVYSGYAVRLSVALGVTLGSVTVYDTDNGGSIFYIERHASYPRSSVSIGAVDVRTTQPLTSFIHNVSSGCDVIVNALTPLGEYRPLLASGTGAAHVRTATLPPIVTAPGGVIWGYSPVGAANGPLSTRAANSGDNRDVGWSATSTIVISSERISIPAASGGFVDATMDAGVANGVVAATYESGTASLAVIGRYRDDSNCIYALATASALTLVKRVAASSGTTIASAASYTRAPGDVVALKMNGDQVSVLLNGTEVIAPQTIADHLTATKHGAGAAGSTGAAVVVSAVSLTAV